LNRYEKFFGKLGLTETEGKIALFLILFFMIGLYIFYFKNDLISPLKAYDYKKKSRIVDSNKVIENKKIKSIDSNKIVYQISGNELKFSSLNKNEKINLQTASIFDIMRLPFISKENAELVIKLRNEGKIEAGIDLVKYNVLSRQKYDKIKKFLINEKN